MKTIAQQKQYFNGLPALYAARFESPNNRFLAADVGERQLAMAAGRAGGDVLEDEDAKTIRDARELARAET